MDLKAKYCKSQEEERLVTFTINNERHECVNLIPAKCRLLYEGNTANYYLLVDRSLYQAENDCGVFRFKYIKEI